MNSVATVTVLFTDLVASTQLRTTRGDLPAHGIVMEYESAIREQVRRNRGREVKTLGDGLMVVFNSSREAVECAIETQRALAELRAANPGAALDVRMGIHTGDVVRNGGDVHGAAVVAAARITARARGGEILVSEMVRGVIGAVTEFNIAERGRFTLKGFPSRWRLYQVQWQQQETAPIVRRRLSLLVTDLTGSTATNDRLGDDAAFSLLRSHNAIVRAQVAAHRGTVVKSLGDGFLVSFKRSDDAVNCAAQIQHAFERFRQGSAEPLNLRIAVHEGDFIEEAGDLYGKAIIVAFRVLSKAASDEVLVTERVRGSLGDSVLLGPATRLWLPGISEPETVFALCWNPAAHGPGQGQARLATGPATSRRSRLPGAPLACPRG